MGVKNVRVNVRGKMVVLTWEYGGACHTMKRETGGRDVGSVLWAVNKLLAEMEQDPDGMKMLKAGRCGK